MSIEYDEAKNQSNIVKHGVGFEEAARAFLASAVATKEATDEDSNWLLEMRSAQSLSLSVSGRAANGYRDPDRLDYPDARRDYGEKRRICLGILPAQSICDRVFVLAYTLRGNAVRIISARKANEREQNHYYLER